MTTETATKEKIEVSLPKKYKVIFKDNGDGSSIVHGKSGFIRDILLYAFNCDPSSAVKIIKQLDRNKIVVIGTFSKQIAETMVNKANEKCSEPHSKAFMLEAKMEQE